MYYYDIYRKYNSYKKRTVEPFFLVYQKGLEPPTFRFVV